MIPWREQKNTASQITQKSFCFTSNSHFLTFLRRDSAFCIHDLDDNWRNLDKTLALIPSTTRLHLLPQGQTLRFLCSWTALSLEHLQVGEGPGSREQELAVSSSSFTPHSFQESQDRRFLLASTMWIFMKTFHYYSSVNGTIWTRAAVRTALRWVSLRHSLFLSEMHCPSSPWTPALQFCKSLACRCWKVMPLDSIPILPLDL